MVKNLPAMQDTWVRFLGQEDSLEEEMTTHSSVLAWEIPWTEEPGGLWSMGLQRIEHNEQLTHIILIIGNAIWCSHCGKQYGGSLKN